MGRVGSNSPNRSRWRIPVSSRLSSILSATLTPCLDNLQQQPRTEPRIPWSLNVCRLLPQLRTSHHRHQHSIIFTIHCQSGLSSPSSTHFHTILTDHHFRSLQPNPDYPHRHQHFVYVIFLHPSTSTFIDIARQATECLCEGECTWKFRLPFSGCIREFLIRQNAYSAHWFSRETHNSIV